MLDEAVLGLARNKAHRAVRKARAGPEFGALSDMDATAWTIRQNRPPPVAGRPAVAPTHVAVAFN